jgi:hypothetical protein
MGRWPGVEGTKKTRQGVQEGLKQPQSYTTQILRSF